MSRKTVIGMQLAERLGAKVLAAVNLLRPGPAPC